MNIFEDLGRIRGFCFDVDGVFTNNEIIIHEDGSQIRTMNIRDGVAIKRALDEGFPVGIITAGTSEGVKKRFNYLGVEFIHTKTSLKMDSFLTFLDQYQLEASTVLYMGDDILDFEVMQMTGFPCCPSDADVDIKQISRFISPFKGGHGCVRDIVERVLRIQDKWF